MLKKASRKVAGSTFCFALLAASAAHAGPRHHTVSSVPLAVPKVRTKIVQPAKAKVYVSASHQNKPHAAQIAKAAKPAPPPAGWKITPKFEDRGKEATTYGFMFHRKF
jgi:hypothetical protein